MKRTIGRTILPQGTYGGAEPNNGDEAAILGDSVANITQNGEVRVHFARYPAQPA